MAFGVLFLCLAAFCAGLLPGRLLSRRLSARRGVTLIAGAPPAGSLVFSALLASFIALLAALGLVFLGGDGVSPRLTIFVPPSPAFFSLFFSFLTGFICALFPLLLAAPLIVVAGFSLVLDALIYSSWSFNALSPLDSGLSVRILPVSRSVVPDSSDECVLVELLSMHVPPLRIARVPDVFLPDTIRIEYIVMERRGLPGIPAAGARCALVALVDAEDGTPLWRAPLADLRRALLRAPLYRVHGMGTVYSRPHAGIPVKLSMHPADNKVP